MDNSLEFSILLTKMSKIKIIDSIDNNKTQVEKILKAYLHKIFENLKSDKEKPLNKINFLEYCSLPGILQERFFQVLDKNKDGFLDEEEFIEGLILFYCGTIQQKVRFLFDFYDCDMDGLIQKEDVRILLSNCPIEQIEELIQIKPQSSHPISIEEFEALAEKRIKNIEEIDLLLNEVFGPTSTNINFQEFSNIVENICSDIFIAIYCLIRSKLPIQYNLPFLMKYSNEIKPTTPKATPELSPIKYLSSQKITGKIFKTSPNFEFQKNLKQLKQMSSNHLLKKYSLIHDNKREKGKSTFAKSFKNGFSILYENSEEIPIERTDNEDSKLPFFDSLVKHPIIKIKDKESNYQKEKIQVTNPLDLKDIKICGLCNNTFQSNSSQCPNCNNEFAKGYFSSNLYLENKEKRTILRYHAVLVNSEIFFYDKKENTNYENCINLKSYFLIDLPSIIDSDNNEIYRIELKNFNKSVILYFTEQESKINWQNHISQALLFGKISEFYKIKGIIGKGKYSLVRKAIHIVTNTEVAIKVIFKNKLTSKELELIRNEVAIMNLCHHPNIIQIYDIFENEEYFYIVMEKLNGEDLLEYFIKKEIKLDENRVKSIFHSLCRALFYLQSFGIIHRDIKLNNIMLINDSADSDVKIVDFGFSMILTPTSFCNESFGTLSFAAPEIFLEKNYNYSVDIWSLGVCLFVMLSGDFPFESDYEDDHDIPLKIIKDPPKFISSHWEKVSPEAKTLVQLMLEKDPSKRITIKDLLLNQWIVNKELNLVDLRTNSIGTSQAFRAFSSKLFSESSTP